MSDARLNPDDAACLSAARDALHDLQVAVASTYNIHERAFAVSYFGDRAVAELRNLELCLIRAERVEREREREAMP